MIVLFKLEDEEKSLKSQQKQEKAKELSSKKELLKLCKTELSAQAANHAWNKFNNLINNKVKALNLEGKVHSNYYSRNNYLTHMYNLHILLSFMPSI